MRRFSEAPVANGPKETLLSLDLPRTQSVCVAGSISIKVFPEDSVDVSKLLYPHQTIMGQPATVFCPSISSFKTIQHVQWFKVRQCAC